MQAYFLYTHGFFIMANRSKKVVLSARVPPYLKAGLDILSTIKNKSSVSIIEEMLETELNEEYIRVPLTLSIDLHSSGKMMSISDLLTYIWDDDEILFNLRLGYLGENIASKDLEKLVDIVSINPIYEGEFPLFGDLNGKALDSMFEPLPDVYINLYKIKDDWSLLKSYVVFLEKNKPLAPSLDQYKKMINNS